MYDERQGTCSGTGELTEEVVRALEEERTAMGRSPVEQAEVIFNEHLPSSAMTICKIALHDPDPRLRLKAATYVVDRQLGRAVQKVTGLGDQDPLMKLLSQVEDFANKG